MTPKDKNLSPGARQTLRDYLRYWTEEKGMVHDHPTFCGAVRVALETLEEIANEYDDETEEGAEHWEWGNYDDSYRYGGDVATNRIAARVRSVLTKPAAGNQEGGA